MLASSDGADSKTGGDAGKANPSKPKPAKKPAAPSVEQIAKWAVPDYQPLQLLACYDSFGDTMVQSMAIAPDGKTFALGGGKLTLWNVGDSEPTIDLIAKLKGNEIERPIRTIASSPDGTRLAAGDQKGMLRIWNLSDQTQTVAIRAHEGRLTRLAISPNSETLATTSYSGEVRLWKTSDGQKIKSLKVSDREIHRLEFLTDTLLAAAGSETSIWNLETGNKETVLTKGSVIGPSLGLTSDRKRLCYSDSDSKIRFWDVATSKLTGPILHGASAHLIAFTDDKKLIAIDSNDSNIRIWDAATGQIVQVINGDGDHTVGLNWLPETNVLLIASETRRLRIWGSHESAKALGLQPIEMPPLRTIPADAHKSFSSADWKRIIDIRSFPQLPGAVPQWSDAGIASYTADSSQEAAEQFYRYYLGKTGWQESSTTGFAMPGITFRKEGCELNVSFNPIAPPAPVTDGNLQISLQFSGNYDVRWLPKISAIESKSSFDAFSTVGYRTKAKLTDVEVSLLKQFHDAGWTPYSRLKSSSNEDPKSRIISMLQGGSVLTASIGYPADSMDELAVQISVSISNKSVPIPPDSSWIEFSSATELELVANTKMDLKQTTEFFDTEMAAEGWLARDVGRYFKDERGYMPYIRGQQDVPVRLTERKEGGTTIVIGDVQGSSWQLKKPTIEESASEIVGIEAADFKLPKEAKDVKFEVDQKKVEFEISEIKPQTLAETFIKQLEELDWKRDSAGIMSDDYCFVIFSKINDAKKKAEIEIRIRAAAKKTSAMIGGSGLLWTKPLPAEPVRISFETWLRRNQRNATLDLLDQFADEMHQIPAADGKK